MGDNAFLQTPLSEETVLHITVVYHLFSLSLKETPDPGIAKVKALPSAPWNQELQLIAIGTPPFQQEAGAEHQTGHPLRILKEARGAQPHDLPTSSLWHDMPLSGKGHTAGLLLLYCLGSRRRVGPHPTCDVHKSQIPTG